jgi:hypothetical protein
MTTIIPQSYCLSAFHILQNATLGPLSRPLELEFHPVTLRLDPPGLHDDRNGTECESRCHRFGTEISIQSG